MARIRFLGPALILFFGLLVLYIAFGNSSPEALQGLTKYRPSSSNPAAPKKARYAITSSVQTHHFTPLAMMLGYSILKHNNMNDLDAEMVLLVREANDDDAKDGVTKEDIEKLEKVGWKVRVEKELQFENVKIEDIRAHHRHNLNKLHLWTWTEYEKIVFIDADVVCKGKLDELLAMPGEFAAAPDVWWFQLTDTKFNSGVIVFRPSKKTFDDMYVKVSDENYHKPNEADQAFLNEYYKFRFFGLPYRYNFNLVMYKHHTDVWNLLWDEAVLIHMTMRKPQPAPNHCLEGCDEQGPSVWYGEYFKEMLLHHGWDGQIPVYA
ncbi:nucleotide-diphospho-sugar transferase [Ascodesmis nigricans]|uniref:Nucleotide-diphospho-sugar transferase n=1 Tax=Ascodesmis nigricans TaxID=341454 RepID=A0A4S2MW90_9PEZI|nr:nucleotide-diphospho-sugar transferase [Ascodesmis nigricans]